MFSVDLQQEITRCGTATKAPLRPCIEAEIKRYYLFIYCFKLLTWLYLSVLTILLFSNLANFLPGI